MKFKMKNLLALNDIKSDWFSVAIAILLGSLSAHASAGETFKHGAVMARSIVLDENKQPILVEYNEDGSEGAVVSIPSEYQNDVRKLTIISAAEYRLEQARLNDYKEHYKDSLASDAEIKSRENFEQEEYFLADGVTSIAQPVLPEYVKSVLVRGRSNRIVNDPSQLVLLSFSVDLSQNYTVPEKGSLLLNPKGQVVHSSSNNIAPRVGFFGDPNKKQEFFTFGRKREDEIFGPVAGVKVFVSPEAYPGSLALTDSKGKYSMRFRLPYCPGGFEYTTDVWAELRYANFNANGAASIPYFLRRQDWTYCYDLPPFVGTSLGAASAYMNAMAILATSAVPMYSIDFKVDVMFLSGKVTIKNPDGKSVEITDVTDYQVDPSSNTLITQNFYDFDGDGKADASYLGNITNQPQPDGSVKKIFEVNSAGSLQGVFFSSNKNTTGQPDAIRLADKKTVTAPNGLLKSISKDDLKNTDVMVFRESTGQLVLERRGMRDEEIDGRNDTGLGKDDKYFYYRLMLRGPMDNALNVGAIRRTGTWQEWAVRYKLTEPFQKREADHLKSGEWVRLVIINRATGYMGTQRLQLNDASQNAGGYLSLPVKDIVLTPPNLKIWAERDYTQEYGLEQNKQEKNNIIGMEGASLGSDDRITVYTEWYDEAGRSLPEGLGADNGEQFGLTGRLAKVVGSGQLSAVAQGSLANFPIAPGHNTQVLRVKDNLTAPEHFYIHVSGTQKDENPSFDAGNMAAELEGRPKTLTPFLTPFYDEDNDWKTWSAWNQLKRAYDAEQLDEEPLKPLPSYTWRYRPEYQFSQLALEVNKIRREYTDESGNTKQQELLNDQDKGKIPTIRGDDDLVSVFYSLILQQQERLMPIDGEQDLVFSFGAHEVKATVSATGQISFEDLAHIDLLDPTDLLTIRMYVNHDAGNTLWEWAFTRNGLHVYYQVPGNTQEKSKRSIPSASDGNCDNAVCSDIEILALLEPSQQTAVTPPAQAEPQPAPLVRTLGGMRLRYRYIPPSIDGIQVTEVTWKIAHDGRYCTQYGVGTVGCVDKSSNDPFKQTAPRPPLLPNTTGDWSIYWEPSNGDQANWSNWAGINTEDAGVAGLLESKYTIPAPGNNVNDDPLAKRVERTYERDFTINTRELKPETDPTKVMKGSDVAMLEAMLWQFGISAQKGRDYQHNSNAGISGNRINSKRASGVQTENCDGTDAKARDIFSGGWDACTPGKVALEGMVRRFKGRHISAADAGKFARAGGANSTGIVDAQMLTDLDAAWGRYYPVYKTHQTRPTIALTDSIVVAYLDEVVQLWQNGSGASMPATYTDTVHNSVLNLAGISASGKSQKDLLKAWKSRETDTHWGSNAGYPKTNYRMTEGGADELGSMSFNQVLFHYRYSRKPIQVHRDFNYNYYDPRENMLGFAVHTSAFSAGDATSLNHAGSLYEAFAKRSLADKYSTANGLVGYRHCATATACDTVAISALNADKKDDDYELLARAVLRYNAGAAGNRGISWPDLLRTKSGCTGCGMEYSIDIRNKRFGLPYRQYIWKGGKGVDVNGDGEIKDIVAAPTATPPVIEVTETTVDWCFAYGEREWMSGVSWDDLRRKAKGDALALPPVAPIGRINCN